jgi:MFS family permease
LADNTAILAYLLFYVVYSISAVPSGILSDRIGRRPVLIGGYLAFGITSAGLIFSSSLCSMLFLFMAYGISYAMIDGTQRAFVVDLAPQHLKGTALGVFHTATGMVALPGGYIAGSLWDKISPEATFVYGLSLTAASVVFFFFVKRA